MVDTARNDPENSFDLRSLLLGLRRRAWLIALCLLVTTGAALAFSLLQEKKYTAEASLLFRDPGFDQSVFGGPVFTAPIDAAREASTNIRLVSLDGVADRTARDLGHGRTGDQVHEAIDVTEEGQSDVVAIAATDPRPAFAARLANSFARNFVEFRRDADRAKIEDAVKLVERELHKLSPTEAAGDEGRSLRKQISDLTTLQALQTGNAEVVQVATAPASPSSPKTTLNIVVGAVLGLILGTGLALLMARLDRRLRTPSELEDLFALPVLTTIIESQQLETDPESTSEPLPFAEAEAFRMLRTRLRYFNVDREIKSVLVTSAVPGEGKSTVAWNLAVMAASSGTRTLLIEADLHNQTFAKSADLAPLPGLAEVLTKQSGLQSTLQEVRIPDRSNGSRSERTVHVLVAGATPPNPAELLESEEMAKLLREVSDAFDFVVLDTPPAGVLADTIPLMKRVSGVLVVARLGKTSRDEVGHLREQLANLGVVPLGIIANRGGAGARYGYGYYGEYGRNREAPTASSAGRGDV